MTSVTQPPTSDSEAATTAPSTTIAAAVTTTSTAPSQPVLPAYRDVIAAYPADVPICSTEALLLSVGSDEAWDLAIQGGALVLDGEIGFPCWGMRIGLHVPVADFPAGSVLVVNPETDASLTYEPATPLAAMLVLDSGDFVTTVGEVAATWTPPASLTFVAIGEEVAVPTTTAPGEQGNAPLPDIYWGLEEQDALDLARENGVLARTTVRDQEWLPETDEYVSGRLNFIVEDGVVVDGWMET